VNEETGPADEASYTGPPKFETPQPLTTSRTWTAAFDSYDQRNEWLYYIITRHEHGTEVDRLLAQLDAWRGGASWAMPVFIEGVRRDLEELARLGQSNVRYRGTLTRGGWHLDWSPPN
jgi:hypothetical protein